MSGTILILRPRQVPEENKRGGPPALSQIARLIGSTYIEPIDNFTIVEWPPSKPVPQPCVAFRSQDKSRQRQNSLANFLWRQNKSVLDDSKVLSGTIVILFGDAKFMKEIGDDHQPRNIEHANRKCPQSRRAST